MSDDNGLWLLAIGPAGATALYWALYRYYRNTDKSHAFERETAVEAAQEAARKAREAAATANNYAHDEPWHVAGGALAVGVLLGFLLSRR